MRQSSKQSIELFAHSKLTGKISIIAGPVIQTIGRFILRYSLALVIAWIGGMKFTALEAAGIRPLLSSSPFLSWMYGILSVQAVSNLFGVVEISVAVMIALRPWTPKVSALGSAIAVMMFLTTLSFLFSLPGWEPRLGGFPALSDAGGFLLKDAVLLGAALWSLGESLAAMCSHENAFSAERSVSAHRG